MAISCASLKGSPSAVPLHLDDAAAGGEHEVRIRLRRAVLGIVEVEHRLGADDPAAHGGNLVRERQPFDRAVGDEAVERRVERHVGAGDGRGAGAAVGLDDVAVEGDLALAERLEVGDGAERAPDQALDLLGAAALAPACRLARRARPGGARQHAVLAGDPAPPLVAEEGRHAVLHARGAQHVRVAEAHQAGALGVLAHARLQRDRAHFVRPAPGWSHERALPRWRRDTIAGPGERPPQPGAAQTMTVARHSR